MTKRTAIGPLATFAGIGAMALVLNACGGGAATPAPETAKETKAADASAAQTLRVVRVERRPLSDEIVATGRLVVREEAAMGSELTGYRVANVFVDEGDWVKRGQPMARLDDTLLQAQIAQAKAGLATQKANADFKDAQLKRAESLAAEGAFSQELLEQRRMEAASSRAALMTAEASVHEMQVRQERMTLRAPVGGMVLQRAIRPGEISSVAAPTPYFRIARDGLIEVDAEMPNEKLAAIHEGDHAEVTLTTGKVIKGTVRFVSPRVDAATNLGRARIALPFDKALRAGGFAEARMTSTARSVLSVPASAIRYEAGRSSVMLLDQSNRLHQTNVKLGERSGDYVELIDGPPPGSLVLATGSAFALDGDVIKPLEETTSVHADAPGDK